MARIQLRRQVRRVGGGVNPFDPALADLVDEPKEDDKFLRWTVIAAVVFHVILLAITIPARTVDPDYTVGKQKVYVVQRVRFKQPPPTQQKKVPNRKAKKIPIPDPTPDEPEPIQDSIVVNKVDLDLPSSDVVFSVPDAPPGLDGPAPMQVTGNVEPPVKLVAPQPLFTEEARRARVEGVIILQTVVDALGNVSSIKVLKGLPLGLSESAVETVSGWKFKPATLNGEPVAVYYMLTITFRIQ